MPAGLVPEGRALLRTRSRMSKTRPVEFVQGVIIERLGRFVRHFGRGRSSAWRCGSLRRIGLDDFADDGRLWDAQAGACAVDLGWFPEPNERDGSRRREEEQKDQNGFTDFQGDAARHM